MSKPLAEMPKPIEEIEPGLYWMTQTNLPHNDPVLTRYLVEGPLQSQYIRFLENNKSVHVSSLNMELLRFLPVKIPNVGRPGTGSGPNGEVTVCDEHYELGEQ